jgi:hypothetical protein
VCPNTPPPPSSRQPSARRARTGGLAVDAEAQCPRELTRGRWSPVARGRYLGVNRRSSSLRSPLTELLDLEDGDPGCLAAVYSTLRYDAADSVPSGS